MRRLALPLLLTTVVCLFPAPSRAGGPTVHEIGGAEALAKGTLERLSLDEAGVLRPGPAFDATELDAQNAWAAVRSGAATWIGTGNNGEVLRVPDDGEILRVETGESLMVTALAARRDGGVAAAAFPGGRLLGISHSGETTTLAALPAAYVWALLGDGRGGLWAATGEPGALFHIDAFGAVEKTADIDDEHARCLARRDDALYIGTAPKGRVLSWADDTLTVVRDLEAQEVVGIVPLGDRGLLVAANVDVSGGNVQTLGGLLGKMLKPSETKPGQKPQERASLQAGQVLWLEPTGAVTAVWQQPKSAALALAADGDGAVLGTYPSGRIHRTAPLQPAALLADLPEAEASVLLAGPEGLAAVVTSNPAVLHRRRDAKPTGRWTGAPLDAGAAARWGRIVCLGRGLAELEYRHGETEEPDDTWSGWKAAAGFVGAAGGCDGAAARFLQIRVRLEGEDAELRGFSVVAAAPNRAPVIGEWAVGVEGDAPSAQRKISWKAEDADGDDLSVSLHANREGSPYWIPLVEDEELAKPQWIWNTSGHPDGVYRIRLTLSDAPGTPPDAARQAVRFSAPFRVDNTSPHVAVTARVAGDRLLLGGEVRDQVGGRVAMIRVSVDGAPWRVLAALDGILDEDVEAFEASLPSPGEGAHDIVVQARDQDGNVGAAAAVVTVR